MINELTKYIDMIIKQYIGINGEIISGKIMD